MTSISDYPVTIELPVVWGHLDAFQHVNNTEFFRYFESARIAYFEEVGYLEHMKRTGEGPILAETSCRFRRPLTFPDTVIVGARVPSVQEDRFVMEYAIHSKAQSTLAGIGTGLVVNFDYQGKTKAPLEKAVRDRIRQTG